MDGWMDGRRRRMGEGIRLDRFAAAAAEEFTMLC